MNGVRITYLRSLVSRTCFVFLFAAMVEYAVINYAQIVYIRKQVHDLKGLEQNSAVSDCGSGLTFLLSFPDENVHRWTNGSTTGHHSSR